MTNIIKIAVFLNTWRNYNENGAEGGFWVDLPCNLGEALERLAESTGEEPEEMEVFINDTDIEGIALEVGENDNLEELNEIAEALDNLDKYEIQALEAFLDNGDSYTEALENISNCNYTIYCNCNDMTDVAREYADGTGLLDSIPDHLQCYFDFEALGRDMGCTGNFYFNNYGNCVEIWY